MYPSPACRLGTAGGVGRHLWTRPSRRIAEFLAARTGPSVAAAVLTQQHRLMTQQQAAVTFSIASGAGSVVLPTDCPVESDGLIEDEGS